MRPGETFAQERLASPPAASAVHSAWHSPVPYLFGGLAAMLGLIAFALLILACSYWKLSGYLEGGDEGGDAAAGDDAQKTGDAGGKPAPAVYEERIVVIMAGDKKPTFLATPVTSRASSFADGTAAAAGGGDGKVESAGDLSPGGGAGDDDRSQERVRIPRE